MAFSSSSSSSSSSSEYVFDPPPVVSLSVMGSVARFPVRRVYCIGKNYEDHVKEMGGTVATEPPLWFMKPTDSVVDCSIHSNSNSNSVSGSGSGSTCTGDGSAGSRAVEDVVVPLPGFSTNVHWEAEIVIAIGKGGKNIDPKDAMDCIFGFGVGIDLTARDLQAEFKKKGRPWEVSKSFDFSGPIGALMTKADFGELADQRLLLLVNGEVKQDVTQDKMLCSIPNQVAEVSKFFHLYPGDIIFAGTPAGVGQMHPGDRIQVSCSKGDVRVVCNFIAGPYLA